jgi:hypothetical protein
MLTDKLGVHTACVLFGALAAVAGADDLKQDVKGSRDHPSLARVPGYYIAAYDEKKSDSADFCRRDPAKHVKFQGHRWSYTYKRASAATSRSGAQIRRHYLALLRKAHAQPICDAEPDLDARVARSGRETWVHLRAFAPGESYELEIVEREAR